MNKLLEILREKFFCYQVEYNDKTLTIGIGDVVIFKDTTSSGGDWYWLGSGGSIRGADQTAIYICNVAKRTQLVAAKEVLLLRQDTERSLETMRVEIKELREMITALLYAPGGEIYQEAKANFEARQN